MIKNTKSEHLGRGQYRVFIELENGNTFSGQVQGHPQQSPPDEWIRQVWQNSDKKQWVLEAVVLVQEVKGEELGLIIKI